MYTYRFSILAAGLYQKSDYVFVVRHYVAVDKVAETLVEHQTMSSTV